MQGRFKMEYRLFTIVRYNYGYYNNCSRFFPLCRSRSGTFILCTGTGTYSLVVVDRVLVLVLVLIIFKVYW
jgi:hypothetical protein